MTEEQIKDKWNEYGRIKYVEPNDVFGYGLNERGEQVAPLTPPYEDLCIAFNLIIETYDRMDISRRNEIGLMWTDKVDSKTSHVSVVDGSLSDNEGHKFLSTYYTEISPDGFKKKEMIEGLGVENIQVSFESYYTPTVSIKFIDVKGSALLGREEAIHTSATGTGEINGGNIFGAFMTQPYPRFRLQVKGFYGKDVTYQLTVSDLKASFNEKTGNCELNVSFVGYTWSLLTDIPLSYLVAAPYCNYVGKKYWEDHEHDYEWRMNNSDLVSATRLTPPKLAEFFEEIKACIANAKDVGLDSNISQASSDKDSMLMSLKSYITDYNNAVKSDNKEEYSKIYRNIQKKVEEYNEQDYNSLDCPEAEKEEVDEDEINNDNFIVSQTEPTNWDVSVTEGNKDNMLTEIINEYELWNTYHPDDTFDIEKLKNALVKQYKYSQSIWNEYVNLFNKKNKIQDNLPPSFTQYSERRIVTTPLNDAYNKFYKKVIDYDIDKIKVKSEELLKPVDFSNLKAQIEEREVVVKEEQREKKEQANREFVKNSLERIGIDPNIYNIFKILMCHLETFVHILFSANAEIVKEMKDGLRSPEALGTVFNATDLPSRALNKPLPAWTMVMNKDGNNINDDNQLEYTNAYKWVGNLKGSTKWIEERVVWSLQNAIQHTLPVESGDSTSDTRSLPQDAFIPTLPSDIIGKTNCFAKIKSVSFDNFCANLGVRMAQILGIMDNRASGETIKAFGELDAYNYYLSVSSNDDIKTNVFEPINNGDAVDIISSIMKADKKYVNNYGTNKKNNGEHSYIFSYEPLINGEQPIFVEQDGSYEYSYMKDSEGRGIVPSNLIDFNKNSYKNIAQINNDGKTFTGVVNEDGNTKSVDKWLYCIDSQTEENMINKNMMSILHDETEINFIEKWYDELNSSNMTLKKYTTEKSYGDFLKRYWKITYEDYKKRVNNTYNWHFFGAKSNKRQDVLKQITVEAENKTNLFKGRSDLFYELLLGDTNTDKSPYNIGNEYGKLDLKGKEYNIKDEIYIKLLGVKDTRAVNKLYGSLFAHPFYYEQNNNSANLDEDKASIRTLEAKAFLFLQSLPRSDMKLNYEFTEHGGFAMWSKASLLYLGGMLYRQDYYDKTGNKYELIQYDINHPKCQANNKVLTIGDVSGLTVLSDSDAANNAKHYKSVDELTMFLNKNIKTQLIEEFKNFARSSDFIEFIDLCELKGKNNETLNGQTFKAMIEDESVDIIAKNKVYDAFYRLKQNGSAYLAFKEDDSTVTINALIKSLCFGKAIVMFNSRVPMPDGITIPMNIGAIIKNATVHNSNVKTYLTSFIDTLRTIVDKTTTPDTEYSDTGLTENIDVNDNILLSIYIYCKNVWEKWLLPLSGTSSEDEELSDTYYDVKRFFDKNFVFVDTYYNDIKTKLKINLDVLYDKYIGRTKEGTLFSFISDIVAEHRSIFVGLPDYIDLGLGMGDEDTTKQQEAMENLKSIFKPLPYSKMGSPRSDNHFVVMYTYPPASKLPDNFSYKYDGFDIFSVSTDEEISNLFKCANKKINENEKPTAYGYNIPAFSVAFGRQHNHLFKNFSFNMNNPIQTEAAINALWRVMELSKGSNRRVSFYGQDIYNIYTNYSYQIEVEMMGNAQIQPLMYFQLSNIPIWRGMYMIFNVTHTMTAGNMVTRFKGMKMTRYPVPMLTKYWSFIKSQYFDGKEPYNSEYSSSDSSYGIVDKTVFMESGKGHGATALGASSTNMDRFTPKTGQCANADSKFYNRGHNNYYMPILKTYTFKTNNNKEFNLKNAINFIYNFAHITTEKVNKETLVLDKCTEKNPFASTGYCARHVWSALQAGGLDVSGGAAWKKETTIPAMQTGGVYKCIYNGNGVLPQQAMPGDVVLQEYKVKNKKTGKLEDSGHAVFFTGKHWVSDFIQQNGLYSAHSAQGIYSIWRIQGIENEISSINPNGNIMSNVSLDSNNTPPATRQIPINSNKVSDYDDLFKKYANEYGFDWRLMAAISFQESSFNPNVGNECCHGLMGVSKKYSSFKNNTTEKLKEPENNISEGVKMFAENYKYVAKYAKNKEEQIKFTLAAYNWGVGNLSKAINKSSKNNDGGYTWYNNVENYAPKETKEYVSHVIYNYNKIKDKIS